MEEDCLNEFTLSHLLVDLLNPVAKTIASNGCDLPPSNTTSSPLMPISFGKTCPKLRNIRSRILLENTWLLLYDSKFLDLCLSLSLSHLNLAGLDLAERAGVDNRVLSILDFQKEGTLFRPGYAILVEISIDELAENHHQ